MSGWEKSTFIRSAGALWEEAIHSPFLDAIGSGTLPADLFDSWLTQDYRFAQALVVFQSVAVARCPRQNQGLLIAGLAALDSELTWFEEHAKKRRLDLDGEIHPVCRRYADFLIRTAYSEAPSVLLGTLFGVEVAYLAAWSALKPTGPYAEFVERWSNPGFRDYVQSLRIMAEDGRDDRSQEYFNQALIHENDFWTLSYGV